MVGVVFSQLKLIEIPDKPETLKYDIFLEGKKVGNSIFISSPTRINGERVLKLFNYSETEREGKKTSDSTELVLRLDDLSPIMTKKSIRGKVNVKIETRYKEGKAELHLESEMGEKSLTFDFPPGSYDNDEIVYLLRFIDLKGKKQGKLVDIVPSGATTIEIEWKIEEGKKVKIKEKDYDVYQVELSFLGRKVKIFYEMKKPRRMVKYEDETTKLQMFLSE